MPFHFSFLSFFLSLGFLLAALYLFARPGPRLQFPSFEGWQGVKKAFPWSRVLMGLLILLTTLLLLDPKLASGDEKNIPLPLEGKSWTLLIDRSGSMWRTIPSPNGEIEPLVLYAAHLFEEAVNDRQGDLVGLVAFARKPDILLPLTPDRKRLQYLLSNLSKVPKDEDGTAITYSLYKTLLMIQGAKEREKTYHLDRNVLILVTDGLETIPEEDAKDPLRGVSLEKVLKKAEEVGVHLYILSLFPKSENEKFGAEIRTLQKMANRTHGGFFQATPEGLADLFKEVDEREGSSHYVEKMKTENPLAPSIALLTLFLLFLYLVIHDLVYLSIP